MVDATHGDGGVGYGDALLICHHSLDAAVNLSEGTVKSLWILLTSNPWGMGSLGP